MPRKPEPHELRAAKWLERNMCHVEAAEETLRLVRGILCAAAKEKPKRKVLARGYCGASCAKGRLCRTKPMPACKKFCRGYATCQRVSIVTEGGE